MIAPRRPSATTTPQKGILRSPLVLLGLGLLGVVGIVVVVIVVAGGFLSRTSDSLWDYGQKRIAADIADPELRGITRALSSSLHNKAIDQVAPRDLRGRRGLSMPDPEPYYSALRSLIRDELRPMDGAGRFDESILKDFWESRNCKEWTSYVVHLKSDGTYRDAAFDLSDSRYENLSPMPGGTWRYNAGILTWRMAGSQDDPNSVVRKGPNGFVLKEGDGSYTYFRRLSPPPGLAAKLR